LIDSLFDEDDDCDETSRGASAEWPCDSADSNDDDLPECEFASEENGRTCVVVRRPQLHHNQLD
jgi:hypothetical protein